MAIRAGDSGVGSFDMGTEGPAFWGFFEPPIARTVVQAFETKDTNG